MSRPWILLLALLGASLSAISAATTAAEFTKYRIWHDVCLQGDVKKIDAQIEKFEHPLAANPKDDLAKAFLGSAHALRAKYGKWGPTKLKHLKRGKKLMEEAIAASPNDARVRTVRAIAYYKIPKRFGVRQTSLQDFNTLIPIAKAGGKLQNNERQAILYYAALAYEAEQLAGVDDLKKHCRQIDPKSQYGQLCK